MVQPEEHIDPEVDDADLDEQRQPVDEPPPDPEDEVKGALPVEVPEADLLEQSVSVPFDDDDLPHG